MKTTIPAVANQSNAESRYNDNAITYNKGGNDNITPSHQDIIHTTAAAAVTKMVCTIPKKDEQVLTAQHNADKVTSPNRKITATESYNNKRAPDEHISNSASDNPINNDKEIINRMAISYSVGHQDISGGCYKKLIACEREKEKVNFIREGNTLSKEMALSVKVGTEHFPIIAYIETPIESAILPLQLAKKIFTHEVMFQLR